MTDMQTGPPVPEPSLYDIGRFLGGGLNMTVEQARDMIRGLRSRMAGSNLERGHDDVAEIEYDILADLVDGFDRLVAMWEDDNHMLVLTADGWTIEHSLRCRATGDMAGGCWFHRQVAKLTDLETKDEGRYKLVKLIEGDDDTMAIGPAS